jgi:hypothetical protein
MRKLNLALAATAAIVIAGFLASSAQAANPCKAHSDQASCSADKACAWDTTKNKCKQAK